MTRDRMRMLAWVVVAAALLAGCALSNDIGFLLTGRAKDISWRNLTPVTPSSPTPAPTWCQGARDTWNGFGCSMR